MHIIPFEVDEQWESILCRLKWIRSQAALDFCIAAAIVLLIMETSGEWVAIIVILRTFTGKNSGCSLAN